MRKVIAALLLLTGFTAHAQFAAQWNFQDFTQNRQPVKQVYLTLLANIQPNGVTNIVASQRQSKQTDSSGSLIVSNLVYGMYRVEFVGPTRTNAFTNSFPTTIATNSLVNAADPLYLGTNSINIAGFDSVFVTKIGATLSGDLNAGGHSLTNVTDVLDANGNSLLGGIVSGSGARSSKNGGRATYVLCASHA